MWCLIAMGHPFSVVGSSYKTRSLRVGIRRRRQPKRASAILYARSVQHAELEVVELPLVEALGDLAHVVGVQLLVRFERAESRARSASCRARVVW